jgi:hypothetical protein
MTAGQLLLMTGRVSLHERESILISVEDLPLLKFWNFPVHGEIATEDLLAHLYIWWI